VPVLSAAAAQPRPDGALAILARASGLAAGYGREPVIENLDFAVHPGEQIALLGPNGGGKTTLLRVLLGELRPLAGTLEVNTRCASVPQTERSRLDYPVSALDVVMMGCLPSLPWWRMPGREGRAAARRALERVGMEELAERTFGLLSGGQRQRVLIARGLVQDAGLLLLDEPFNGLDRASANGLETLIGELAAEGRGVLIATHDLNLARRWDLVLCLNARQIAFGRPDEVLDRSALEATYGGAIVELPSGGGLGILPPHHH
jgi:ABC-type Mn2+/Zn2+ transport system ATPase subunit